MCRGRSILAGVEVGVHRVVELRELGGDSVLLVLEGPFPEPDPGAFAMLALEEGWPCLLPRPFSYFALFDEEGGAGGAPRYGRAGFLVKAVGPGTRALAKARAGALVRVTGPLGRGFPPPEDGPEPVCIAGGVGIAPFLPWVLRRRRAGAGPVPVLFGGRTAAGLAGRELFPADAARLYLATEDGSLGYQGTVLDLFDRLRASGEIDAQAPVLCCGPDPMMAAVAAYCRDRGLQCRVSLETVMACGYGVCYGCSVAVRGSGRFAGKRYARACVDGPVFDAEELVW